MSKHTSDPSTARALVTIEVVERLAVRAVQTLDEVSAEDLSMAPLWLLDAIERSRAILGEITSLTSDTTCSLVKDQDLSDDISHQAHTKVAQSMQRVARALEPK